MKAVGGRLPAVGAGVGVWECLWSRVSVFWAGTPPPPAPSSNSLPPPVRPQHVLCIQEYGDEEWVRQLAEADSPASPTSGGQTADDVALGAVVEGAVDEGSSKYYVLQLGPLGAVCRVAVWPRWVSADVGRGGGDTHGHFTGRT